MVKNLATQKYALGVDLGGTNLSWGAVSESGEIIIKGKVPSKGFKSKQKAIDHIIDTISENVASYKRDGLDIIGVGIGVPGLVVKEKGYIHKAPNFPELNGVYMQKLLEDALSLPVIIENDVNAWAWGEHAYGAARQYRTFMVMTLGTGVGGGIVIDDKLIDGRDGTAGEVGHITVYPDGLECACGNHGCLEKYASATGILQNLRVNMDTRAGKQLIKNIGKDINDINSHDIYLEAKQGDEFALSLFKKAGEALGIAMAGIVNLLNLEAIIIGGGVSAAWDIIVPEMKRVIGERAFSIPAKRCKILKTVHGDNGGILGMARMIFDKRELLVPSNCAKLLITPA